MNFAGLQNYYEHLVFDYIARHLEQEYSHRDEDFFLDVACYALARLPARYIRHKIDMLFYLTPGEQQEMEKRVMQAVDSAAQFISAKMDEAHRE